MFRGREQSRPELGFRLLQRLAEDVQELGFVESAPKQDGRNMIMVLGPTKKKADARAERAADRARREGARDESATPTAPADAATEDATAAEATPDIGAQPEAAASEQPVA
jgi:translation initiation factor IF-3